jgi:hypothetical protein
VWARAGVVQQADGGVGGGEWLASIALSPYSHQLTCPGLICSPLLEDPLGFFPQRSEFGVVESHDRRHIFRLCGTKPDDRGAYGVAAKVQS